MENNFEKNLKDIFENASISPSDVIWSKIEKKLDNKKDIKNKRIFFALALFVGVFASTGYYYQLKNAQQPPAASDNITQIVEGQFVEPVASPSFHQKMHKEASLPLVASSKKGAITIEKATVKNKPFSIKKLEAVGIEKKNEKIFGAEKQLPLKITNNEKNIAIAEKENQYLTNKSLIDSTPINNNQKKEKEEAPLLVYLEKAVAKSDSSKQGSKTKKNSLFSRLFISGSWGVLFTKAISDLDYVQPERTINFMYGGGLGFHINKVWSIETGFYKNRLTMSSLIVFIDPVLGAVYDGYQGYTKFNCFKAPVLINRNFYFSEEKLILGLSAGISYLNLWGKSYFENVEIIYNTSGSTNGSFNNTAGNMHLEKTNESHTQTSGILMELRSSIDYKIDQRFSLQFSLGYNRTTKKLAEGRGVATLNGGPPYLFNYYYKGNNISALFSFKYFLGKQKHK